MYWDEHNPPHFHARYGTYNAAVDITSLKVLEGELPPRVLGLVIEWASIHKKELLNKRIKNDSRCHRCCLQGRLPHRVKI